MYDTHSARNQYHSTHCKSFEYPPLTDCLWDKSLRENLLQYDIDILHHQDALNLIFKFYRNYFLDMFVALSQAWISKEKTDIDKYMEPQRADDLNLPKPPFLSIFREKLWESKCYVFSLNIFFIVCQVS